MKKNNILTAVLSGAIVAIINFVLFIISIKYILDYTLELKNIIAYVIFSILIGLIAFALYLLKPKIAFSIFVTGLLAGFIFMFETYSKDMDGWGDLIGFLTFLILALIGLIGGLIIQFIVYLIKRKNSTNKDNKTEDAQSLEIKNKQEK